MDAETEELEESRTYRPRAPEQARRRLLRIDPEVREREAHVITTVLLFQMVFNDATVKILAKRHKDNADISYHIVATASGARYLIRLLRRVNDEEYRKKVAAFEEEWVRNGPLQRGLVVTKEEWQRYQQQLPEQGPSEGPREEGST